MERISSFAGTPGSPTRPQRRPADGKGPRIDTLFDFTPDVGTEGPFSDPSDAAWYFTDHGYEPALEHEIEARFALANGFLGLRGSLDQRTAASHSRTYVAGLYVPADGASSALFSAEGWFDFDLLVNGTRLSLNRTGVAENVRTLDLRRGLLLTRLRYHADDGTVVVLNALKFASLATPGAAVQIATVQVSAAATMRLQQSPLYAAAFAPNGASGGQALIIRPPGTARVLAVRAASSLQVDGTKVCRAADGSTGPAWSWEGEAGKKASMQRVVAAGLATTAEEADRKARSVLRTSASSAKAYQRHVEEWARRWSNSDVTIKGDKEGDRALRFAIYHLISAGPAEPEASVGARALTGDGYKGHIFWDADIFLTPFYTFTQPQTARALLAYRFRTLPAARRKADAMGYRGALYAWESTDTGDEETPRFALGPDQEIVPISSGVAEHHISADVAFATWHYWWATHDHRFMRDKGAEVILETSRFWVSRVTREADGRFHIKGVIGPDEYHEDVTDNAYTNVMAAFNIECGLAVARLLERRWPVAWRGLCEKLSLTSPELQSWDDVRANLATGFDPASGIFEQFRGFFDLEEIDLGAYAARTAPMDVVLGRTRTSRAQVIKQADSVMLMALLGERFEPAVQSANFRYYEPRTAHGSSLSPPIHALVAARLGMTGLAKRLFDDTAAIDLSDTMGNSAGGIHIGAMGGMWQAALFGFAGLKPYGDVLGIDPRMPASWREMDFAVQWRKRLLRVRIVSEDLPIVTVSLERGQAMPFRVGEWQRRLQPGETWRCQFGTFRGEQGVGDD